MEVPHWLAPSKQLGYSKASETKPAECSQGSALSSDVRDAELHIAYNMTISVMSTTL